MKLSLRNLLLGVVVLMIALVGISGAFSLVGLGSLQKDVVTTATIRIPSLNVVNMMDTNTSDLRIAENRHVMATMPEGMDQAEAEFTATLADLRKNQATYEPLISSEKERQTYAAFKEQFASYMQLHDQLFVLSRQDQKVEAGDLLKADMRTVYDAFSKNLLDEINLNIDGANADYKASVQEYQRVQITTFVVLGISLVLGLASGAVILGGVIKPIRQTTDVVGKLSQGQLNTDIPYTNTRNEVGDMARTLMIFRDDLREANVLRDEAERQKGVAEVNRKAMMNQLADEFEKSVGGIVSLVSSAATEMQASAQQLSATAQETSAQSVAVSAAAEEAGTNVTSVASSAEELGASVAEIGRQVEQSSQISNEAVREASKAATVITELNVVASSIGSVVDMINSIASQTNLLALNATIESARAGEAGKGFAVVASEVKQLAGQTARATTDISGKITLIQNATTRAVAAIEGISNTIAEINSTSAVIAAAVEQQGAATREIVQAVAQASMGTAEVTSNISGVAQAAEQTGDAAAQVLGASGELSGQAERLHQEMDKFLSRVRAA